MATCRPAAVQRGAFIFCRTTLAVLLWAALPLRAPWLVALCALILAASAILGVRRAPLVALYAATFGRRWPGGTEVLDERGMRFAHTLGTLLVGGTAVLLYAAPRAGLAALFVVAVLKTVGACGFCTALRLYRCLTDESCCAFLKRRA